MLPNKLLPAADLRRIGRTHGRTDPALQNRSIALAKQEPQQAKAKRSDALGPLVAITTDYRWCLLVVAFRTLAAWGSYGRESPQADITDAEQVTFAHGQLFVTTQVVADT
jgi:hypothetical protein